MATDKQIKCIVADPLQISPDLLVSGLVIYILSCLLILHYCCCLIFPLWIWDGYECLFHAAYHAEFEAVTNFGEGYLPPFQDQSRIIRTGGIPFFRGGGGVPRQSKVFSRHIHRLGRNLNLPTLKNK